MLTAVAVSHRLSTMTSLTGSLHVFLIHVCVLRSGFATKFIKFERESALDNYTCEGSALLFEDITYYRTVTDCLALCRNTTSCRGVFFGPELRTCRLCNENFLLSTLRPNVVPAGSSETHFYRRDDPSTHGEACTITDDDCSKRQYCGATGYCICDPGYSYSSVMDSCSSGCLVYGESYEEHRAKYLHANNIQSYSDITQSECQTHCNSHLDCRTFDNLYKSTDDKYICRLQDATALTQPDHFRNQNDFTSHFHRNCRP